MKVKLIIPITMEEYIIHLMAAAKARRRKRRGASGGGCV